MPAKVFRILAKIERAKKHLFDLQLASKTFFDSNAYVIGIYNDLRTRNRVNYLFAIDREIPVEFCLIAGDVLHNLRSALDHLAYQLAVIHRRGLVPKRRIFFPIADSAEAYKSIRTKIKGQIGQDATEVLDALKPYKDGNDRLWRLNELSKIDKHRLLITVGLANLAHSMTPTQRRELEKLYADCHPGAPPRDLRNVLTTPKASQCPLKVGDILLSIPESEVEGFTRFHFDIAFSESGIIEGQSVFLVLDQMANLARNIILSFERLLA